jgi:hypothetical protein
MKHVKSLLALATIVIMGLVGCSKGSTGPAGPAGPAGPDSVYSSPWISLNATQVDTTAFVDSIVAQTLTKGILDSGMILSYVNLPDQNGTYHVVAVSAVETQQFYDDYSIGQINIFASFDFTGVSYRYVSIPGSKTVGNSVNKMYNGYTIKELKSMSFEKVQQIIAEDN